jgi:hypothetical protein
MRRFAAVLAVVGAFAGTACHSKSRPAGPDANRTAATIVSRGGPVSPARFSRPLAAIRAPGSVTLIAGLVVPSSAIALTALGADGATRWTHDVITGVLWSANATLSVLPSKGGAIVVWRGLRGGQEVTVAVGVSLDGKMDGEPYPVGAAACVTDTDLAWVDHGPKGTWLVWTRAFGAATSVVDLTLPEDRDPAMLCGTRTVFALGAGDDDVTLSTVGATPHATPLRVQKDADFRGDEERGHEVYAVGDALGIVRFGLSGSVATREVVGRELAAWRRFGKKLALGDDLALVDADVRNAVLVYTHDPAAGSDDGGSTVEAFVWERSGTREASQTIAPADASRVRGPFWSGAVPGGIVVGWAERGAHADAGHAPILGMAYRVVSVDAVGDLHRLEQPADELVDAGCDDARCYAVALARAAGEDGGQPEVAAVLAYP